MRCLIVGCGGIGHAHARALRALGNVEIAACVEPHAPAREAFSAAFGARGYEDLDACLAEWAGKVHFATVASTPATHYAVAKKVLSAGIPVMVEKPLAMDVREAGELAALAAARGLQLGVGFKMRFEPIFMKARELTGTLGPLRSVSSFKLQPRPRKPHHDWIPEVGAMYELSVHEFDLIHWICGIKPRRVTARLEHPPGWTREAAFSAIVEYDGGVVGSLTGRFTNESRFFYRDLTLIVAGERGYMRIMRPDRIDLHVDEFSTIEVASGGNAFVDEFRAFVEAVERGELTGTADGQAGVWTTAMVEAAVLSDRHGRPAAIGERGDGGVEIRLD